MSLLRRSLLLFGLVLAGTFSAGVASAAAAGQVCLPVYATGVGHDNGDLTTDARIFSLGFMVGTSHAEFELTPTGFSGPIVFTTALGKLTAKVDGVVDFTTGKFEATSTSVSGAGLLRGVTGQLKITGTQDQRGDFTEMITGRLCLRT